MAKMGLLGCDIESLSRWRRLWRSQRGRKILKKLFTDSEWRACLKKPDAPASLAARWCAKEAVFKALCLTDISLLKKIHIRQVSPSKIRGVLRYEKKKSLLGSFQISLSHTKDFAMAVVVKE